MTKIQEIPNKLYFRIGEVSELVGVRPYVLRYWESEFPDIKPTKSKSGQRLYKRKDVESLLKIRQLLYEERFTIDGARKRLKELVKFDSEAVKRSEPVVTHVEQPKPLKTFVPKISTESPQDVKTQNIVKTVDADAKSSSEPNKKVFVKLRKDLEGLLGMVKQ